MIVDVDAHVVRNVRLSDDYNEIELETPEIAGAAEPGQFVMVRTSSGYEPLLRRPFSVFRILRDPAGRPRAITLLNKRVGVGTNLLYKMEPGSRVPCLGPLGRPFDVVGPPTEAWLVAGGVGLAPFASLAERLHARGTGITLFYGGRRASDLFFVDLFERIGAALVLSTEDGSLGEPGRITAPLERHLRAAAGERRIMVYACGPEGMLAAVARLARASRIPSQISVERMMGCGLGGCYSCVVRVNQNGRPHYVRSCLSGPVFRGEDLADYAE